MENVEENIQLIFHTLQVIGKAKTRISFVLNGIGMRTAMKRRVFIYIFTENYTHFSWLTVLGLLCNFGRK